MSTATHWARMGEAGTLLGMRLLVGVHRLLGRWPFLLALYPVVGWYFLLRRSARQASREYLARLQLAHQVFDRKPGLWLSFRHFLQFADALLDKVLAISGRFNFGAIAVHGRDDFLQLVDAGRGAILLTAHIGNLEVCRALAGLRPNLALNILVHSRNAQKFNRLLAESGAPGRVRLIEIADLNPAFAMDLADRLQRGEMLVIAADRVPPGARSVQLPFLAAPAAFPAGPFILAGLLRCPVHLVFCSRRDDGYRVQFEPFAERIELPRRAREDAVRVHANAFAQRLEAQCVAAPLQWFNFYPFWSTTP